MLYCSLASCNGFESCKGVFLDAVLEDGSLAWALGSIPALEGLRRAPCCSSLEATLVTAAAQVPIHAGDKKETSKMGLERYHCYLLGARPTWLCHQRRRLNSGFKASLMDPHASYPMPLTWRTDETLGCIIVPRCLVAVLWTASCPYSCCRRYFLDL